MCAFRFESLEDYYCSDKFCELSSNKRAIGTEVENLLSISIFVMLDLTEPVVFTKGLGMKTVALVVRHAGSAPVTPCMRGPPVTGMESGATIPSQEPQDHVYRHPLFTPLPKFVPNADHRTRTGHTIAALRK
ncbi:hypothetical protein CMK10_14230 [Candidatus Poribacteria bacterium]|nr:hypothetical protein [Candidatus Poribacteria bacterium]